MTVTADQKMAPEALTLEDITSLYDPPPTHTPARRSILPLGGGGFSRRGVLRTAWLLGTTAAFTGLGVFPKARPAAAHCTSTLETTIVNGCPVNVGNCSPACGDSTVNTSACGTNGFHKYTGDYRGRPNHCWGSYPQADGWNWAGTGCCGAAPECTRRYRCHDGCSRYGAGSECSTGTAGWKCTICRVVLAGCPC